MPVQHDMVSARQLDLMGPVWNPAAQWQPGSGGRGYLGAMRDAYLGLPPTKATPSPAPPAWLPLRRSGLTSTTRPVRNPRSAVRLDKRR
jgi:hypothetical protein